MPKNKPQRVKKIRGKKESAFTLEEILVAYKIGKITLRETVFIIERTLNIKK